MIIYQRGCLRGIHREASQRGSLAAAAEFDVDVPYGSERSLVVLLLSAHLSKDDAFQEGDTFLLPSQPLRDQRVEWLAARQQAHDEEDDGDEEVDPAGMLLFDGPERFTYKSRAPICMVVRLADLATVVRARIVASVANIIWLEEWDSKNKVRSWYEPEIWEWRWENNCSLSIYHSDIMTQFFGILGRSWHERAKGYEPQISRVPNVVALR